MPNDKIDWVLQRNPISYRPLERIKEDKNITYRALNDENFIGKSQNIFCYYKDYTTTFIKDLNSLIFGDKKPFDDTVLLKCNTVRSKSLSYLSLDEIDDRGLRLSQKSNAKKINEPISLYKTIEYLKTHHKVNFELNSDLGTDENYSSVLGVMDAKNKTIKISNILEANTPRWRFTLAHEVGHYILHRGFMLENLVDEHADVVNNYAVLDLNASSDTFRKLEWQANMFANSLLMPRNEVFSLLANLVRQLDIRNFNNGIIYVDHQQCNLHNYNFIVSKLKGEFNVSATIVEIRLKQLRILNDKRTTSAGLNIDFLIG